jgi:hypothetical protein
MFNLLSLYNNVAPLRLLPNYCFPTPSGFLEHLDSLLTWHPFRPRLASSLDRKFMDVNAYVGECGTHQITGEEEEACQSRVPAQAQLHSAKEAMRVWQWQP